MLSARATVETQKADRYMRALCNHFARKVTAEYEGNHGTVQFGFGNCEFDVTDNALNILVQAEDNERLAQVKDVVGGHLERFAASAEALTVEWIDE
jgi:hypothetical protein